MVVAESSSTYTSNAIRSCKIPKYDIRLGILSNTRFDRSGFNSPSEHDLGLKLWHEKNGRSLITFVFYPTDVGSYKMFRMLNAKRLVQRMTEPMLEKINK